MNATQPASAPQAVATMDQFFTRQRANEGIDLPLSLPDGTPTTHSIRIRGVDSDTFKAAEAESSRRLSELTMDFKDKPKIAGLMADERMTLVASLVISWTFPQPATIENIKALFKEAPQIMEQVDRLASKRSLFFRLGSLNSTPSPAPSSS